MDRETESMITTMEERSLRPVQSIKVDFDIEQPIQELFDNCLNFISLYEFFEI